MENLDPKTKIENFFQNKVLKYELVFLFFLVLLVFLALLNIKSGIILTLFLASLAVIYFFSAFSIPEITDLSAIDLFIQKLVSLGSSVALIGILFKAQKWPNADTMLYCGFFTMIICLFFLAYKRMKDPSSENFNKFVFLRSIILLIITGLLLFLKTKYNAT
jgi:hypothetical protein